MATTTRTRSTSPSSPVIEPDEAGGPLEVTPTISIVIPLYNEEDSIPSLWEQLDKAIANYGKPAQVIIVDDG